MILHPYIHYHEKIKNVIWKKTKYKYKSEYVQIFISSAV